MCYQEHVSLRPCGDRALACSVREDLTIIKNGEPVWKKFNLRDVKDPQKSNLKCSHTLFSRRESTPSRHSRVLIGQLNPSFARFFWNGKSHLPYAFKETPFALRRVSFSLRHRRVNETFRGGRVSFTLRVLRRRRQGEERIVDARTATESTRTMMTRTSSTRSDGVADDFAAESSEQSSPLADLTNAISQTTRVIGTRT